MKAAITFRASTRKLMETGLYAYAPLESLDSCTRIGASAARPAHTVRSLAARAC